MSVPQPGTSVRLPHCFFLIMLGMGSSTLNGIFLLSSLIWDGLRTKINARDIICITNSILKKNT